jgi:hypothetical protein
LCETRGHGFVKADKNQNREEWIKLENERRQIIDCDFLSVLVFRQSNKRKKSPSRQASLERKATGIFT